MGRISIARRFPLIAASERFAPQTGKEFFDLDIAQSRAFDARGRHHTLNGGDPPQARQLFGGQGLDDLPAPFELIDVSDELEDFGRNRDVLDLEHRGYIHFDPFIPDSHSMAKEISIYTRS